MSCLGLAVKARFLGCWKKDTERRRGLPGGSDNQYPSLLIEWVDVATENDDSAQPFVLRLVRDIMRSIHNQLCVSYHMGLVLIIMNQRY